jgi:hypothetical protein
VICQHSALITLRSWRHIVHFYPYMDLPTNTMTIACLECSLKNRISIKCSVFWHMTLCWSVKRNRYFGGTCCLHLQGRGVSEARLVSWFVLVSCLTCSSNLKMGAICCFETWANFHIITRCYVLIFHNYRFENLNSIICKLYMLTGVYGMQL